MKKLLIFLFAILLLLNACSGTPITSYDNQSQKDLCISSGGSWTNYSSSCTDTCDRLRSNSYDCDTKFTESCDCGGVRCWNGHSCENIF